MKFRFVSSRVKKLGSSYTEVSGEDPGDEGVELKEGVQRGDLVDGESLYDETSDGVYAGADILLIVIDVSEGINLKDDVGGERQYR